MNTFIISRHPATIAWLQKQLDGDACVLPHLNQQMAQMIQQGDRVIGNLPLKWVAQLTELGAEYYSIELDYTKHPELRGKELTEDVLEQCKIQLNAYKAHMLSRCLH